LPFLIVHSTIAQTQPYFEKINQKNGLSNERVNSIVKETNGFVWIGTSNGLNKYDGKQIKIYTKQNSSLNANDISDLLIDSQGRFWVATLGGGLNRYIQHEDKFETYKNIPKDFSSIVSNEVNVVFEDSKGGLWLGTKDGLSYFDDKKKEFNSFIHNPSNKNSLSHNDVRSVFEDASGLFWIGTYGGGLNKFDPKTKKFKKIEDESKASSDFIHSISEYKKGTILIGTNGKGLLEFDTDKSKFKKIKLSQSEEVSIIRCIKKNSDGSIWIATDGNGVFKIKNSNSTNLTIYNYTHNGQLESSISSNSIYEIMEDEQNNLWLGSAWNGINVANTKSDHEFLLQGISGSVTSPVLSIYADKNDFLIGLDGKGLKTFHRKSNKLEHYSRDSNKFIGGDYFQFISKSSYGSYWLGTFVNGLINFDPSSNKIIQYNHDVDNLKSLSYNDVRYILIDEKENLWITTWGGGLNYFNQSSKEFTRYQESIDASPSISSNNAISLQKDGDNLWVSTFGGGLNLFNTKTKRFDVYRYNEHNLNSISSDYIYSLLKDSKGNLWIGTSGEGVNLFNTEIGKFNRFDSDKDIRYQTISSIIEDNNGQIWFSTKKGIFNYNYTTNSFKNFPTLRGDYHINAATIDENGYLYFGGSKGVLKFNPNNLKNTVDNPEVRLTNFKLFNKDVVIGENEILNKHISFTDKIILKYNLDVITFEFAAMKFPFSDDCEYAIKLENFDRNWRVLGKERTATFTNISSGDYVFKVKSRALGGEWEDNNTSLQIKILKPFWLTWWAFIIYGLLIVLAFYVFRKYIIAWEQMQANLKLEKLTHEKDIELHSIKQQFFTNISHEIRTPVTLILGSLNRLLELKEYNDEKQLSPITALKKNSNRLMKLVDELLDFRKLEHNNIQLKIAKVDLSSFCEEIYYSFKDLASEKKIDYTFNNEIKENEVWIDKNQMDKVLYNLLSNAFKFTLNGGSIQVKLKETEHYIILVIKDKGVGISKKQLLKIFNRFYQIDKNFQKEGFGLGLSITKKIVDLHHGEIIVDSKKGIGSTFTITLKKGNSHFKKSEIKEENEVIYTKYLNEDVPANQESNLIPKDLPFEKNKTILVVEDNLEIQEYVVKLLSDEFNILRGSNGKEALQIVDSQLPDLIISDIMMPEMGGIELVKKLKSNIRTSHIPIILLTARDAVIHKKEGFDIGVDAYITKPFNEVLLKSRINNILRNRELLHERLRSEEIFSITELSNNDVDLEFLQSITKLIDTHLDSENLNIDLITKQLGMSRSVIYKKLKALTGMSIVEFVRDYKLKIAKQLLIEKECTVADACYHIGYTDRKYFSKLFKHRFGKAPSEYIRK
jgi:signal transduction histidine kinase/ligand-binding sensor domain-containing protein/DNA-binding response OmpR family regulator